MQNISDVRKRLFEIKDEGYRDFNSRLIPTVDKNTVIGVRTPDMRKLAKEIATSPAAEKLLEALPHEYYEENNLHAFLIERIKDFDECIKQLDRFLPYVDNWATCDLMSPKVLKRQPQRLLEKIKEWTASGKTYTVRFGIEMLMSFFLDDLFLPEYLEIVADIRSDEYYVNMMIAWFFATALAKQYSSAVVLVESRRLDEWTHNKTIQKSCESYRITDEQKTYLRSLKIKKK